ncbi:unnamed protein product [Oppiella nova]|uniref:Uncharacterized protein n=1 Tax=Oppiella nova TaxID=334625 RepID=A0A7R9MKM8_9ACAR|nr:unnamed protein product [Oppiella nova]CAG2178686.1 unnamed protein product [Oppiella nova]
MNEFLEVNNDVNCDLNGQMGDSQVVTTDDQYLESPIIQSSHTCQANSSVCENIFSQKNTSRLRGLNSPREPIRLATDSTKKISELFKKYKK